MMIICICIALVGSRYHRAVAHVCKPFSPPVQCNLPKTNFKFRWSLPQRSQSQSARLILLRPLSLSFCLSSSLALYTCFGWGYGCMHELKNRIFDVYTIAKLIQWKKMIYKCIYIYYMFVCVCMLFICTCLYILLDIGWFAIFLRINSYIIYYIDITLIFPLIIFSTCINKLALRYKYIGNWVWLKVFSIFFNRTHGFRRKTFHIFVVGKTDCW